MDVGKADDTKILVPSRACSICNRNATGAWSHAVVCRWIAGQLDVYRLCFELAK